MIASVVFIIILCTQTSVSSKRSNHFDIENHPNLRLLPQDTCRAPFDFEPEVYNAEPYYGEFPWSVLVFSTVRDLIDKKYSCAGYIINNRYIVTTAYCCNFVTPEKSRIRAGDYDIYHIGPECGRIGCGSSVNFKVEEVIKYPQDYTTNEQHDICLIRTRRRMRFSDFIHPICLPLNKEHNLIVDMDDELLFVGWTYNHYEDSPQKSLLKKRLLVTHVDYCYEANAEFNICVEEKYKENNLLKKTCAGIIGNVLLKTLTVGSRNVSYAVGHFSGEPLTKDLFCSSGLPETLTRLSAYTKWILDNIRP